MQRYCVTRDGIKGGIKCRIDFIYSLSTGCGKISVLGRGDQAVSRPGSCHHRAMASWFDRNPLAPALASAPDTSFSDLILLTHHRVPAVRQAVARNPAATRNHGSYVFSILEDLASSFPEDVMANPGLIQALGERNPDAESVLSNVLYYTKNEELLRDMLAKPHPNPLIRCSLARNRRSPIELLAAFVRDPDQTVRLQLAFREDTPAELLRLLAADTDREVRRNVAAHKNTPADVLEKLASDPEHRVNDMVLYRRLVEQEAAENSAKKTGAKSSPAKEAPAKRPAKKAAAKTPPAKKVAPRELAKKTKSRVEKNP